MGGKTAQTDVQTGFPLHKHEWEGAINDEEDFQFLKHFRAENKMKTCYIDWFPLLPGVRKQAHAKIRFLLLLLLFLFFGGVQSNEKVMGEAIFTVVPEAMQLVVNNSILLREKEIQKKEK